MRISRRLGMLGAAATMGVLLAGCGQSQAGAAITYDGGRITENYVAEQAAEAAEALGIVVTPRVTQVTIQRLATNTVVEAGAEELGVTVTGGEVDRLLNEAAEAAGGDEELTQALINQGVPVTAIPTQARVSALALKMAEELAPGGDSRAQDEALGNFLVNVGEEINLTVNPRFGQWRAEELTVVPTPDILSRPADNAFALEESFSVN